MNPGLVAISYLISESISNSDSLVPQKEVKQLPISDKKLWNKYKRQVWKITKAQNLKKLENFDKRAFNGYHLDHKVSIWYGFKNRIDPKLIGSIDNLEFIPWKDNCKKSIKCNFDKAKDMQTIIFV